MYGEPGETRCSSAQISAAGEGAAEAPQAVSSLKACELTQQADLAATASSELLLFLAVSHLCDLCLGTEV